MTDRYPDAQLDLSLLPAPAVIKTIDYEATVSARMADFVARLQARGIAYDVQSTETDPGVVLQEEDAYRETIDLAAINDAAKAVMILYARGSDQDDLFALLGIRRRILTPADPVAKTAAVMEGDTDFMLRAQIALDGSAPGLTGGGYAHVALRASSEVRRVSLIRGTGGAVSVVLQGFSNGRGTTTTTIALNGTVTLSWVADTSTPNNDGSVSDAAVRAVATALNDDWSDDESTGSQLTDVPMVQSATPLAYDLVATATVPQGPAYAPVANQSLAGLIAAAQGAQLVANAVPTDLLIAAGRIGAMGKFSLVSPAQDVVCSRAQVPWCRSITLTVSIIDG